MKRMDRCLPILCLVLVVAGCATVESQFPKADGVFPRNVLYVEQVPFYPQTQYQCGPASLAAVLNYWGQDVTPEVIGQAIYRPQMKGTLSLDLWQYAKSQNVHAAIRQGSWEFLELQISRKRPVIAFLNLGFQHAPIGHYEVVVGLDPGDKSVITYSGVTKNERMSYARFKAAWEKTKFWSLLIESKEGQQDETA
jgi:predicted double-glycine peptidase